MLREIMPYLKYSPCLVAVHLSNNPGINCETKDEFGQLLAMTDDSTTRSLGGNASAVNDNFGVRFKSGPMVEFEEPNDGFPDALHSK